MAKGSMKNVAGAVGNEVEILRHANFTGEAMTLDTTAFTAGVCKAGQPIDADGKVANSAAAIGINLYDVLAERPQATIVVGGYINKAVAEAHAGISYSSALALKNVVIR